jgi:energy-coupling factor transport system ATP-binding protein
MEIHIDAISFTYPQGVQALSEVSLRITAGESVGVLGQNGAGKTTLAKHLNGLLKPGSGSVSVGGWDTREHSVAQMAARVGFAFQNPDDQLFQSTVWAEVTFGPKNLGWAVERVEQQAAAALEAVGLRDSARKHPYDLSANQRKNVALATVLAMDTPVVIFDEPTTGQDYAGVELVGRVIEDLKRRHKTVIAITHDVDFCAEHFERVVVMARGGVLLDGPARVVLGETQTLAQSYVDPPQLVRLARRLGLAVLPMNAEELVGSWKGSERSTG